MSQKLSKQFVYLNFNQTNFHEYDADFYENVSPGRETNHFGHKNISVTDHTFPSQVGNQ